jgi:hypothetical protein
LNLEYFFCDWRFSIRIKIQMKISDFKFRWKVLPISSRSKFIQYYNMWSRASWLGGWVETVFHNNGSSVTVGVCAWQEGDISYKSRFSESKSGVGPRNFQRVFPVRSNSTVLRVLHYKTSPRLLLMPKVQWWGTGHGYCLVQGPLFW